MSSRNNILLAPMAEMQSSENVATMVSWREHLTDNGFEVFRSGFESGVRAIFIPSTPLDDSQERPLAMSLDTLRMIEGALNYVTLFSERPIADNFRPLRNQHPDHPTVRRFNQLKYELGEIVTGQDVSVIQKKLGVK